MTNQPPLDLLLLFLNMSIGELKDKKNITPKRIINNACVYGGRYNTKPSHYKKLGSMTIDEIILEVSKSTQKTDK